MNVKLLGDVQEKIFWCKVLMKDVATDLHLYFLTDFQNTQNDLLSIRPLFFCYVIVSYNS